MNRTPWRRRREPLDHVEPAALLPAPGDPVLSRDRLTTLEEHLMNEIRQAQDRKAAEAQPQTVALLPPQPPEQPRRTGSRRLALAGAAVAIAVLAGAIGVAQLTGQETVEAAGPPEGSVPASVVQVAQGTTEGLSSTVDRISGAAVKEKLPEPRPGQFIYIRSQVSWLSISENADTGKNETYVQKLHARQVWLSPDGRRGWLIEPGNGTTSGAGMTLDDEGEALEPSIGAPSYDYLKTLTTDPDELLRKIYKETKGQGNGPDQQAFTTIGDLVMEQVMPAELTSALYRAAAKIPGVVVVDDTTDAVGRHGIAIARTDETSGDRTEWIFDPKTFSYLGERTVQMRDVEGVEAGTVTGHTAITERAVVDAMKELPGAKGKV
ncbi:CU044_5270 family protein [Streptomyces sp. NPDC060035]|uniref:CU044_5270 family protein n=1 Tax=Streptomyces sp. NPDC060035 TaxID=3347044 RepID=UPI0036A01FE6